MLEILQLIGIWTLFAGVVFLLIIPMLLCSAYHALDFYFFIWKEMSHSYVKHKHTRVKVEVKTENESQTA